MGKTERSKRQNKQVAYRCGPPSPNYQPKRKFHSLKAVPTKKFKEQLEVKEKLSECN